MKKNTKEKTLNILRWVALIPAICITWWIVIYICACIARFLFGPNFFTSDYSILTFIIISFVILPAVAMFFTAKYIAPKYKIIMGCIAVAICILWVVVLFYNLSHMAY